jgi:uncharacterized membrane protein
MVTHVGPVCFLFAFGLVGLGVFALWLWMLIDAATRAPTAENVRIVWVLIVILLGPLGAILYLIVQRPKNPPPGTGPPLP